MEKALKRRRDKVSKDGQEDDRKGLVPARAVAWAGPSILENSQNLCGGSHLFFQLFYIRIYVDSILEPFRKKLFKKKKKTQTQNKTKTTKQIKQTLNQPPPTMKKGKITQILTPMMKKSC